MKRFIKNSTMMIGVVALLAVLAIPAEGGRRHHCRGVYVVPPYHAVYQPYYGLYPYHGVHRVHVSRPMVVVPVPHYRVYYGPRVYVQGYVW